jgi:hypothetical protein
MWYLGRSDAGEVFDSNEGGGADVLDNILSMREQSIRLGLSERRRTRLPIRRLSDTSSVVIAVYVWSRWNMH